MIALTTARDDTEENVAKFRTRVAWYNVRACCLFCMTAGMTSDTVRIAEDHAIERVRIVGYHKLMQYPSHLRSENLPGINQLVELDGISEMEGSCGSAYILNTHQ